MEMGLIKIPLEVVLLKSCAFGLVYPAGFFSFVFFIRQKGDKEIKYGD
jgi:hypothetical protein